MDQFKNWIGDYSAQSKVVMRQYIISKGYKSIADVGCGVATEYDGYKNEGYQIDYVGIDSCSILVNRNKLIGIPMIESNCEKIPLPDNSVDVAYSRHVFEHQPSFVGTLAELIRIGRKEAIHVFFINPNVEQIINYDKNQNLFHNQYKLADIDAFLKQHHKVVSYFFNPINEKESSLHVILST